MKIPSQSLTLTTEPESSKTMPVPVASSSRHALVRLVLLVGLLFFGNTFCDTGTYDSADRETCSAASDSQDTDVSRAEWPGQPTVAAILHSRDASLSREEWQDAAVLSFVAPAELSFARGAVTVPRPLSALVFSRSPMSARRSPRAPPLPLSAFV